MLQSQDVVATDWDMLGSLAAAAAAAAAGRDDIDRSLTLLLIVSAQRSFSVSDQCSIATYR